MIPSIYNTNISNKTILLRTDFNVPIDNNIIQDKTRIDNTIPTIKYLLREKCKIVIISHLGRPNGQRESIYSLQPIYDYLKNIFPNLIFAKQKLESLSRAEINKIESNIILLENIRFHDGEEANNIDFAKKLASFADIFVNDAFGCSHRKHASIASITNFIPTISGHLMNFELDNLYKHLQKPNRPIGALIGGAKISSKLSLIRSMIDKVDYLIIAGAMSNTFLKALNNEIGTSLYEPDFIDTAKEILNSAKENNVEIILPRDFVVANDINSNISELATINNMPHDKMILDIGPDSIHSIKEIISKLKTIIWNGPLGVFEYDLFAHGTKEIAMHIAELTRNNKLISIAGGGDSISAINKCNIYNNITHISTGGGAFLKWLENKSLPEFTKLN